MSSPRIPDRRRSSVFRRSALSPAKVGLSYLAGSALYIIVTSFLLVGFVPLGISPAAWETLKGLAFVSLTAGVLYFYLRREANRSTESERSFHHVVETLDDALFVVEPGTRQIVYYANAAAERIFGYERDEMLGRSTRFLHVDDTQYEGFAQNNRKALARGEAFQCEFMMRRKDGTVFPTEHLVSPLLPTHDRSMVVSVVRDVTNWKNRDREIRESEERFRQIAENIGEVFWMSDPQKSRMLYVSKAYERIWGRPVASVYSEPKSFMDAIHPDDRARVEAAVGKQSEGPYDEEYRIVRPDGATRYIRDRGFPVHADDGRLYRIVGVAEDFTEEHEREERMLHAQKLESLGQLTGGVAHDFNNLLMVILGTLQLLTESDLSERDRGRVERAQRAAKKGADLTRRLMAFSRSEPLGAEVVDLNDRLSEMWPILIRDCGETIKLTFAPDPRIRNVDINAGEFESAMLNLVINARDAMPEGGRITIRTAVAAAELLPGGGKARTVDADPAVLVEVADTGAGMSQDVVQRAFEPFFTTKAVGKSIGLGLSMVHGFASQSGGRAAIESRVGEGTTVRLFLPGIGAMTGSGETPESAEPEGVRTGGSVLLVEDNADVRETTTALLDWLGYTVETADDGPMALEILDKRPNFDIVLSDVVMPKGMSGFDLAEEVSQRYPQIRILLYSGYAERSLDELSKSRLRTKILSKPLNLNDLARALGEATSS